MSSNREKKLRDCVSRQLPSRTGMLAVGEGWHMVAGQLSKGATVNGDQVQRPAHWPQDIAMFSLAALNNTQHTIYKVGLGKITVFRSSSIYRNLDILHKVGCN